MKLTQAEQDKICRALVDRGKLLEAGFVALRYTVIPDDAPQVQVEEMRKAYFAGAQHLWASIMSILEPGVEATEKDLKRMTLINRELEAFVEQLKRQMPT